MVNDAEVAHLLNLKLYEEVAELMRAEPSERLMEMADVLQVLHDLAKAHGFTPEQVEEARVDKFELLGGFSLGWALEWKPEANDR
jgi:predicted house-cleaning noncanonical NTP pyrophosphatase (MazG superfamily)